MQARCYNAHASKSVRFTLSPHHVTARHSPAAPSNHLVKHLGSGTSRRTYPHANALHDVVVTYKNSPTPSESAEIKGLPSQIGAGGPHSFRGDWRAGLDEGKK